MFSRQEDEVLKMDLYILSFCISNFCRKTLCGDSFLELGLTRSLWVFCENETSRGVTCREKITRLPDKLIKA